MHKLIISAQEKPYQE